MLRRTTLALLTISILTTVLVPAGLTAGGGSRWHETSSGERGVVATDHPLAAQVGIDVLNEGGNAMDAAVATAFALGVVRFEMCGVGGGGFLVYRGADGETAALDFREESPSQGYEFTKGIFGGTVDGGGDTPFTFGTGHQVIGVPGFVAGLEEAATRFGSKPFGELVRPAAELALGFPVSPRTAFEMTQLGNRMRYFPEAARVYYKAGVLPYLAGEQISLPDYSAVLEAIAAEGSDVFYRGWIAQRLIEEMERPSPYPDDHSAMTLEDLASYEPVWRQPLGSSYRKHQIVTMPPPTSGGTALIEILNILEGFDLGSGGHPVRDGLGHLSADHIHVLAEAQKIAWADRNAYLGDPDHADPDVLRMQRHLTNKGYAATRRKEIDLAKAQEYAPASAPGHGGPSDEERGSHTAHVSVIDEQGNAVALTCSIELPFGSAVVAPGTGFLLNNQLTDFTVPGSGSANEPAPGKRPRSSMTPAIVVYGDEPVLVTGAAGGAKIIMGVTQMVSNVIDFGLDLSTAIDAARIDARAFGPVLNLEDARLGPGVVDDLRARGHEIQSAGEYAADPIVNAVGHDFTTGYNHAITDPRADPADRGAMAQ